jgi:hypothetical protein
VSLGLLHRPHLNRIASPLPRGLNVTSGAVRVVSSLVLLMISATA